ncbi:ABC transporter ATP-binding protein/permease [Vallitalea pronyensis]|uniref:ABC transporter ATP-binding protein/permease n=1 Tax=Vallitalea pronyensis TaxID=1348613 RepID=A0A8J8MHD8_9FIRM|nr:ABC transporter ATP-binding protein/permease [Vallitalea pronyensis]QUI21634.1 ABC transporter ATP-binding protein/permease [Vallitalea pronyensis]
MTKKYHLKNKTVHAVNDVNLEFHKGEFVSILGLSGSGKTTLVSQIGGLDKATEGRLIVDGVDTTNFKQQDWNNYRKNNIGFVFQDFNLISHLTAKENIEIALSLSGLSPKEKSDRADELLALMGIADQEDQLPKQLSGGQKQRVAIARALSNKPDIILADEPTGALDPDTSVQIMEILQSLAEQGHLVIMVTHNKYLARDYSTRIVELKAGEVISNEEIKPCKKYKNEALSTDKSSLQFMTALKIAFNNLKIRKKSTIFLFVSLIPSMILIIAIMNLIFNIDGYKKDVEPLLDHVLSKDNMLYLSPYDNEKLEGKQSAVYRDITRKKIHSEKIEPFIKETVQPYSHEDIHHIENIKGVEKVLKNMTFHVTIDDNDFILVALPPKAYSAYQPYLHRKDYPDDNDEGVIFSSDAAKVLLGKYATNTSSLAGQDIAMNIDHYKSVPLGMSILNTDRYKVDTKITDVFERDSKTVLMRNYYAGYIFTSQGYAEKLKERFTLDDFSLFECEVPLSVDETDDELLIDGQYLVRGHRSIADPLKPLRAKTSLQEKYDLFDFKEYGLHMKGNNYSVKHTIITNDQWDKNSLKELEAYGVVSHYHFDQYSVASSRKTNNYIKYSLFGATIAAVIVILIPALLVCVILYISILLRIKEIGILKSIGARNRDILHIFTMESGLLACSSGLVSFLLAIPVIQYIRHVLEEKYRLEYFLGSNPMNVNVMGIVAAFLISVGLITLIGLLPGKKASQLQPNALLKHD